MRQPARCFDPRKLVGFLLLLAVLAGCGRESEGSQESTPRVEPLNEARIARLDSLRARRNAALAKRPDTLGMRADSARILGDSAAKVWVIITSDFQCAECRDFALNVLPELRREFVDKGLVRLAFVNRPMNEHFNARFAALAALCAGASGRFWQMHDSLFAQQAVWARMPDPRPYMDSLAAAAGVQAEKQTDCISRNRMLYRLSVDLEQSDRSSVSSVPTVFVGDRRLHRTEMTASGVRRAVESALEKR